MKKGNQGKDDWEKEDWEKEDDNDWDNDDINSENDKYENSYKYYYDFTKWESHPQKELLENIAEVKAYAMKNQGCVLSRNSDDRYAIIGVAFAYPLSLDENYH